jgi:hypothetical protein
MLPKLSVCAQRLNLSAPPHTSLSIGITPFLSLSLSLDFYNSGLPLAVVSHPWRPLDNCPYLTFQAQS